MGDSEFEAVPRELRDKDDDAEDAGESGHLVFLRLPRSLSPKERGDVRVFEPEGRPPEGADLPAVVPQEHRALQLRELQLHSAQIARDHCASGHVARIQFDQQLHSRMLVLRAHEWPVQGLPLHDQLAQGSGQEVLRHSH